MYKRFIAILLCCTICVGLLILPANAASLDSDSISQAGTQYLNYYSGYNMAYLKEVWYSTDVLSYDLTSANRFAFKWTPDNELVGSYMLFAIQASKKPDAVSVRFSSPGSYVSATYEGAIPSTPNFYFYRVSMPAASNFSNIEIYGSYSDPYSGNISIASCFGVRNLLSVYDRAEFIYVPIEKKTEGEFAEGTYNAGTQFFPYSAPAWLGSSTNFDRVDFNIRADGDRFNTSAVGRVSLLVTTFCENITATVSLVAKDSNIRDISNIKCNISTDHSWGIVNQYGTGLGTMYNQSAYQIDFDLTGYDMSNFDLQIFISVGTVPYVSEGSIGTKLFDLHFRSMQYVPTILSDPWYKPITDVFRDIGYTIDAELGNVRSYIVSSINGFKNNVVSWFQSLDNRWVDLMDKLDVMLGVSSDQQSEVESNVQQNTEKQEEVTDKSDQLISDLEEIEEQEEEMLTVPEIDQADLALGTLIPQSGLTLMNNVMVTITNNDHVSQMIVLVLSIAVVGVLIL